MNSQPQPNQPPFTPPTPKREKRGGVSSAVWALIGVALGFLLPVFACGGLMMIAAISASFGPSKEFGSLPQRRPVAEHVRGPMTGPAVAIIPVNGPIMEGKVSPWTTEAVASADEIIPMITEAKHDDSVKAIVLEVNSPGGSVVASDRIYHALKDMDKPIVVMMGELAASGGYYISMAGKYIIANPNTLTGSIGVISTFPNASGLMDKLGIQMTVVKSGKEKDFGSPYREMTPEERAYWQKVIDETYNSFVEIVAQNRHMPKDKVLKLADGRVYTGKDALKLGLIDALGYEDDAIAKAADLGGITDVPRVIRYKPAVSPLEALLGSAGQRFGLPTFGLSTFPWNQALAPSLQYRWLP